MRNIVKPPTNYVPPGAPAMAPRPAPVGLVNPNTPAQGTTSAPIDNRVQAPSQYATSTEISGARNPIENPATCMNVNWKQPTTFSLYSELPYDIYDPADPGGPGSDTFDLAQCRMIVTWGDSNTSFQRDMPVGTPISFTGTFLKVNAYIVGYQSYPGQSPFPPVLTAALARLNLLAVEGDVANDISRPIDQFCNAGADVSTGIWGTGLPSTLLGLSGFQESASTVYFMLFDHGIDSGELVADGRLPIFQFKVPSGENFSVAFGQGMSFIHGGYWAISSTPGVLTAVTPVPGAVNVQYVSNAPGGNLYAGPPT